MIIELTNEEVKLLLISIQRKEKHFRDNYKNAEKHGMIHRMEKHIDGVKKLSSLKKKIEYRMIDEVGFYEEVD